MGYQYALYEKRGRIAYITINRPAALNALHSAANEELSEIFDDFQQDESVWVAILTGAGERGFCTGMDLKHAAGNNGDTPRRRGHRGGFGGIDTRFDLWKPVIAAVNGYCLAGGFEIMLACDITIAADHAKFGLPEPKWGQTAGPTGFHRLVQQIPAKIAMGMLLTGRFITAQEAHRVGLVNEIVPMSELMSTAEQWAEEILACAPLAIRGTKQAALQGRAYPLEVASKISYEWETRHQNSVDRLEGPRAFAEKRTPIWTAT